MTEKCLAATAMPSAGYPGSLTARANCISFLIAEDFLLLAGKQPGFISPPWRIPVSESSTQFKAQFSPSYPAFYLKEATSPAANRVLTLWTKSEGMWPTSFQKTRRLIWPLYLNSSEDTKKCLGIRTGPLFVAEPLSRGFHKDFTTSSGHGDSFRLQTRLYRSLLLASISWILTSIPWTLASNYWV